MKVPPIWYNLAYKAMQDAQADGLSQYAIIEAGGNAIADIGWHRSRRDDVAADIWAEKFEVTGAV